MGALAAAVGETLPLHTAVEAGVRAAALTLQSTASVSPTLCRQVIGLGG